MTHRTRRETSFRDGFGPGGALLATLVKGKIGKSGVTLFADVLANEVANNPEPEDIDSNPVGLLRAARPTWSPTPVGTTY